MARMVQLLKKVKAVMHRALQTEEIEKRADSHAQASGIESRERESIWYVDMVSQLFLLSVRHVL